jgi:predicted MFS family arabinose efflux permease
MATAGIAHGCLGASYSALPVVLQTQVLRVSEKGIGEATTSIYVLVFNCSIAAGALVGGFAIDTGGPTIPVLIGALFCVVSIVAIGFIHETAT